jgi:hypothetical protein
MRRAMAIMDDDVDATAGNDLSCFIAHLPHTPRTQILTDSRYEQRYREYCTWNREYSLGTKGFPDWCSPSSGAACANWHRTCLDVIEATPQDCGVMYDMSVACHPPQKRREPKGRLIRFVCLTLHGPSRHRNVGQAKASAVREGAAGHFCHFTRGEDQR